VGDTRSRSIPEKVTHLLKHKYVIQLDAGHRHSLALTSDGVMYSWGYGRYGETGHGTPNIIRIAPLEVHDLKGKKVVAIGAGGRHSIAATMSSTTYKLPKEVYWQQWEKVKTLEGHRGKCICFRSGQTVCAPFHLYYACETCEMNVLCRICASLCHQ
jgi:hypothetical protein